MVRRLRNHGEAIRKIRGAPGVRVSTANGLTELLSVLRAGLTCNILIVLLG